MMGDARSQLRTVSVRGGMRCFSPDIGPPDWGRRPHAATIWACEIRALPGSARRASSASRSASLNPRRTRLS